MAWRRGDLTATGTAVTTAVSKTLDYSPRASLDATYLHTAVQLYVTSHVYVISTLIYISNIIHIELVITN